MSENHKGNPQNLLHGGPGRSKGWTHASQVRDRIRVSMIVNRLHKHVAGELKMSSTQIKAAEILLRKAVPDLKQIEHTGEIGYRNVRELTDEQLIAIATSGSLGVAVEAPGEIEPSGIH